MSNDLPPRPAAEPPVVRPRPETRDRPPLPQPSNRQGPHRRRRHRLQPVRPSCRPSPVPPKAAAFPLAPRLAGLTAGLGAGGSSVPASSGRPRIPPRRFSLPAFPGRLALLAIVGVLIMTAALTGGPDEESVSELVGAIERGKPDQVAALLAKGASAAAADRQGWTPLHFAARGTSAAIVRLLLQHGADPEARDRFGTTPRMVAEAPGLFKWHPPRRAWSDSVPDVQAALGMTLGRPRERDAFGQTVDDLQRHENRHWQS